MRIITNPYKGVGIPNLLADESLKVSSDVQSVMTLLRACPVAAPTPLVSLDTVAKKLGIHSLHVKDERARMGLGSFKSLGATYAIAKAAVAASGGQPGSPEEMATALAGHVFVTASAGNHGISTAAGARIFGAKAVVYLSRTVPAGFAEKLRKFDADVVIEGGNYEASHEAAMAASEANGEQIPQPPTHIFLQAGVGGLAAAAARHARDVWGSRPTICVVEPEAAPALAAGIEAGKVVHTAGPVSNMGRLDCKEASLLALDCLSKEADAFMTLDDDFVSQAIRQLTSESLETSPSGGAGFAGLTAACQGQQLSMS